jgi:hypothetical protein
VSTPIAMSTPAADWVQGGGAGESLPLPPAVIQLAQAMAESLARAGQRGREEAVPQPDDRPPLVDLREAARLFGVPRMTVTRLCDQGRLPCVVVAQGARQKLRRVPRAFIDASGGSPARARPGPGSAKPGSPGLAGPTDGQAELPPERRRELIAELAGHGMTSHQIAARLGIKENPKMSAAPTAFWIDRDYDREHASDGISRYGTYLRDGVFGPWTDNDQAVEWAAFAWERATGPVMSPGYVRYHPRVLAANLDRSGWDGSLFAAVSLACPWPEQLTRALARAVRLGDRDASWQDWPAEYAGKTCYYEPSEAEVAARPYLLATLSLQFTVPSAALPEPPASSAARLGAGRQAVAVVVAELNRIVGPVLAAGLGHAPAAAGGAW